MPMPAARPQPQARLHLLILPLAALIAVLPLLLHGCSCGHDFDFHIINWLEAARQFSHGNLQPHWAYTPAYNAGEPRFIFYPPLSWTIGALLGLLSPSGSLWTWTPILYTWLALTAAGLTLHRLARSFAPPAAALLAATFYLVNPYMLFTAYERTAYAELLAAAWIPLLLHAILRPNQLGGVTIPRIALPIALLWLTNAPAAVMSCYALALLTLIRLAFNPAASARLPFAAEPGIVRSTTAPAGVLPAATSSATSSARLALTTIAGTLLGFGLAAFYLLPAAYQRRFVQIKMAIAEGMRTQDNFLFHHTLPTYPDAAFHDTVLHTASLIAILLLTLTVITLIATILGAPSSRSFIALRWAFAPANRTPPPTLNTRVPHPSPLLRDGWETQTSIIRSLLFPVAALTLTIAFLLTPLSAPLWNHLPELAFLQFPWRLLALQAAALSLSLAVSLTPTKFTPTKFKPALTAAIALTLAAALTYPAYRIFHQPCDQEDTVSARVALFHSTAGTEPTDEYTPLTADNDALAQNNPPYWLAPTPTAKAPANSQPSPTQPGPAPTHFTLNTSQPGFLILNLRDYPTWDITITTPNHPQRSHPSHIHRDDGLIALPLHDPANYTIDVTSLRTPDQTLGDALTLLAIILLILLTLHKPRTPTSN